MDVSLLLKVMGVASSSSPRTDPLTGGTGRAGAPCLHRRRDHRFPAAHPGIFGSHYHHSDPFRIMSVLFKLCGVALLAAGAILILGRDRDKKWAIAVCAVLLIFSQTFTGLGEILLFLREKSELAGVSAYTEPLLKGLGVGAVCLLGGSVCREADASAVADALEIYAGIRILLLSLPFAEKILSAVTDLLSSV